MFNTSAIATPDDHHLHIDLWVEDDDYANLKKWIEEQTFGKCMVRYLSFGKNYRFFFMDDRDFFLFKLHFT